VFLAQFGRPCHVTCHPNNGTQGPRLTALHNANAHYAVLLHAPRILKAVPLTACLLDFPTLAEHSLHRPLEAQRYVLTLDKRFFRTDVHHVLSTPSRYQVFPRDNVRSAAPIAPSSTTAVDCPPRSIQARVPYGFIPTGAYCTRGTRCELCSVSISRFSAPAIGRPYGSFPASWVRALSTITIPTATVLRGARADLWFASDSESFPST
jgi:hypothetical protein